jgi:3',5'-cyclic AMP phosphodiesterase CpdA
MSIVRSRDGVERNTGMGDASRRGPGLSRRSMLAAVGTGLALGGSQSAALSQVLTPPTPASARRRVLRLAHLTDSHVQPEKRGAEGLAAAIRHAQGQKDKPELMLFGGDNIMDAFEADKERSKLQFDLWNKVLKDECSTPHKICIGNHDVWRGKGGDEASRTKEGKAWAVDAFGLPSRFYSFEKAGWKFIVLDSTFVASNDQDYVAKLDGEQMDWLGSELQRTPQATPILILSHIPIFSASVFFDGDNEKTGEWVVPRKWMHIDARAIKDLFFKHPHVRCALSGHVHLVDRVDYLGVTYLCNGAVSGAWWDGAFQEFPGGYALVDLYDDGSVEHEFVTYGWVASK